MERERQRLLLVDHSKRNTKKKFLRHRKINQMERANTEQIEYKWKE